MDTEDLAMTIIFQVAYKGGVMVPKKNGGGMKRQKIDTTIRAQYCPFCGKATEANEEIA